MGPAGLTMWQIYADSNPKQLTSPPMSITMLPISTFQKAMRRVLACQVLQFSVWTAHKQLDAVFHLLLVISSVLTSSWRCAFSICKDPLIQLPRGLSSPSGLLSCPQGYYTFSVPQVLFLSLGRHKHVQDLRQRWLPTPNPLALHSHHSSPQSLGFFPPASKTQQVKQLGLNKHSSSFILGPS